MAEIKEGNILEGRWPEKLRVISVKYVDDYVRIEAVGCDTQRFYPIILTLDEIEEIKVVEEDFNGYEREISDLQVGR